MRLRLFIVLIVTILSAEAFGQAAIDEVADGERVTCEATHQDGDFLTISVDDKVVFKRAFGENRDLDPVVKAHLLCELVQVSVHDYPGTQVRVNRKTGEVTPLDGKIKLDPTNLSCFKTGMYMYFVGISIGVNGWPIVSPYEIQASLHQMYNVHKVEDVHRATAQVKACNAVLDQARQLKQPVVVNSQLDGISILGTSVHYQVPLSDEI